MNLIFSGGIVSGLLVMLAIWNYEASRRFYLLMKLALGVCLGFHAIVYLIYDVPFSSEFATYWFIFALFLSSFLSAVFIDRPRNRSRWQRFRIKIGWKK